MINVQRIVLIPVLGLLLVTLLARAADENNANLLVVRVEHDGDVFEAPHFGDLQKISELRQKMHSETADGLFSATQVFTSDLLIKSRSTWLAAPAFVKTLITFGYKKQGELKKIDKLTNDPSLPKEFSQRAGQLLADILEKKPADANTEKLNKDQVYARLDGLFEGLKKLVASSPVGMYLDWKEATVNGQKLDNYVAPVITWLTDNNYRFVMKCLNGLVGFVNKIEVKGNE